MTDHPLTPRQRRRHARELRRRLEELDLLDATYGLGTMPGAAPLAAPPRTPSFSTAITIAATVVIVTLVVLVHPSSAMQSVRRMVGLGDARALPAPPIEDRGGFYAFKMTQQGSDEPVGWDPCQPIRYEVDPTDGPKGGSELIERALSRASAATGLTFEDEGSTDKRPFTAQFVPIGTDRPVVIGWGTAAEFPDLTGDIAGLGGAASERGVMGRRYYVTGSVALDTDIFTTADVSSRPQVMEAIALHEIAHVVGLGHVAETTELMATTNSGQIDFGPGDREGLAILGSLPCS